MRATLGRLTAHQPVRFGTASKRKKRLAGCVPIVCPNRTSFVFASVVSKRQATLGLQATRTPPDLSRFALSVSCRPADLPIKEAKNGQECSNADKKGSSRTPD